MIAQSNVAESSKPRNGLLSAAIIADVGLFRRPVWSVTGVVLVKDVAVPGGGGGGN